jgi:TctA family transporter
MIGPIWRGTVLGSALGVLPGGGAILASFASYSLEKKLSKTPEEFGQGAIEGVAGPESANNAGAQTSFIPMLTLGIPANPVMALMIGALMIQGIQPGPTIITEQATLFWGVVVSMWIGNVFLLILNLPLIGLWVRMISVPYRLLYPAIIVFCVIGVFSIGNTTFDVHLMALFGLLGYIFHKIGCEPTPLLLGFILGPPMEEYLRRALVLSEGRADVLVREPLSALLLAVAAVLLISVLLPAIRKKREQTFVGEG